MNSISKVGVVVIGRNEGDRLKASLASLRDARALIYVDSGSSDGSLKHALATGVTATPLSSDRPFTAARARNTGIIELMSLHNGIDYIQTVDGDCVISPEWVDIAAGFLQANENVATVFGRLREQRPNDSVYNRLCDNEWNVPLGEAESCGGIAMHRVEAFLSVGGFNETLIAGEEPDLCLRLKARGWSVWRIDAEMGTHDAAILRFDQWWRRSVRAGFAYTEHLWRHRGGSLAAWKRQTARFLFWGLIWPTFMVTAPILFFGMGWPLSGTMYLLIPYVMQFLRIWHRGRAPQSPAIRLAALAVIGKFAEALGALKFGTTLLLNRRSKIIEYK
ncbi:glycosyltransferase [Allopontixanthobacter sediminis]